MSIVEGDISSADRSGPYGVLPAETPLRNYQIVSVLGQGSFGVTYLARDTQLDREVAIKEYLPSAFAMRADGPVVRPRSTEVAEDFVWGRDRFLEEARILARLGHASGIVRVHDFLEANGTAYMVMALVRGETLEDRFKRDGPLPAPVIERLLYSLLDGLEQVHEAGFLHRDIKPGNIILDDKDSPTLIDFGASRAAMMGRTATMTAILTPSYAAAEQFTSGKQGPWTDIYNLSATLYHVIVGIKPPSAVERALEDSYLPLMQILPLGFPRGLLSGIDAGLAVRPVDRPQSVRDWRVCLTFPALPADDTVVAVLSGAAPVASPPRSKTAPQGVSPSGADGAPRETPVAGASRGRQRLLWGGAAAAGLLLLTVGSYLLVTSNQTTAAGAAVQGLTSIQLEQALSERRKAEAAAVEKKRLEEEAQRQANADAEAKRAADAELAKAQEERQKAEDELARLRADMAARQRVDAAQREQAEASSRRALEEAARRNKAESEIAALRRAEEDTRQKAAVAAAAKQQADEAAQRKAEAETVARREAEDLARRKAMADAEAKRKADEALAKAQAARQQADEEAARQKMELEERQKAERQRAETEPKQGLEAQLAAEATAQQLAEARANADADAKKTGEAERKKSEELEKNLGLTQADRQRVQVGLSSLGFDTRGIDGLLGPRSREMIAAWQKTRKHVTTGYLTGQQHQALLGEAASALAKHDDEQKRIQERKTSTSPSVIAPKEDKLNVPPTAATISSLEAAGASFDGAWSGRLDCRTMGTVTLSGNVSQGTGTLSGEDTQVALRIVGTDASISLRLMGLTGGLMDLKGKISGKLLRVHANIARNSIGSELCTLVVGPER